MKKCIFNWSGGKDSALALHYCLQDPEIEIKYLVTTINDAADRISMHGVRVELLRKQAESIGIPLYEIRLPEMPGMAEYDAIMHTTMQGFATEGITHAIFGDIFLQDLRDYRDQRLSEAGLIGIYPLWKRDTNKIIFEFLKLGFRTVIACTQERLGYLVGKEISHELICSLPEGVDPCGESGEFHTFTFKGPIFKKDIAWQTGEKVFKQFAASRNFDDSCVVPTQDTPAGFWYCDLLLK